MKTKGIQMTGANNTSMKCEACGLSTDRVASITISRNRGRSVEADIRSFDLCLDCETFLDQKLYEARLGKK